MAEELRKIDTAPFMDGLDLSGAAPLANPPELRWIPVASLRVDSRYQRDVNRRGAANVKGIARNFDWRKFGTVIVAGLGGDTYAIVDGQHRTCGAACRGIEAVPCMVIEADTRAQATAFVAINSQVTLMTPLQIHASRVAAGDPDALALVAACAAGGVTVCRYPVPGNRMAVGETLAVSVMYKMLKSHGPERLGLALRCITGTNGGNPGMIRAALVKALCSVLSENRVFEGSERRLLDAVGQVHLETEFDAATVESRKRKASMETVLKARLASELGRHMMPLAA